MPTPHPFVCRTELGAPATFPASTSASNIYLARALEMKLVCHIDYLLSREGVIVN